MVAGSASFSMACRGHFSRTRLAGRPRHRSQQISFLQQRSCLPGQNSGDGRKQRAEQKLSGGNLQALSPLLIGGVSLLTKRYLRKPLMYGSVISAVASLAYYLSKKKKRSDSDADASVPDGE